MEYKELEFETVEFDEDMLTASGGGVTCPDPAEAICTEVEEDCGGDDTSNGGSGLCPPDSI